MSGTLFDRLVHRGAGLPVPSAASWTRARGFSAPAPWPESYSPAQQGADRDVLRRSVPEPATLPPPDEPGTPSPVTHLRGEPATGPAEPPSRREPAFAAGAPPPARPARDAAQVTLTLGADPRADDAPALAEPTAARRSPAEADAAMPTAAADVAAAPAGVAEATVAPPPVDAVPAAAPAAVVLSPPPPASRGPIVSASPPSEVLATTAPSGVRGGSPAAVVAPAGATAVSLPKPNAAARAAEAVPARSAGAPLSEGMPGGPPVTAPRPVASRPATGEHRASPPEAHSGTRPARAAGETRESVEPEPAPAPAPAPVVADSAPAVAPSAREAIAARTRRQDAPPRRPEAPAGVRPAGPSSLPDVRIGAIEVRAPSPSPPAAPTPASGFDGYRRLRSYAP